MSNLPKIDGYKIIKYIGSGSTSMVYLAHSEVNHNDLVAIKVVERNYWNRRIENSVLFEINMMKNLKHKHIVKMIDYKCTSRYICIILEYCNGGDLSMYIKKRSKLSEMECCIFMQQLASALQFLRCYNICHLDLKPQNIFLTESSQYDIEPQNMFLTESSRFTLKLGDFGLAKYMCENTVLTSYCGSPLYMAPEMLLRRPYDIKADLWSVGVIMYECIFGEAPYVRNTVQMLYDKIKNKKSLVIPCNYISLECKNLLMGLLQHSSVNRLNYDQFFKHPFLRLDSISINLDNLYAKALKTINEAKQLDLRRQFKTAFHKYCTGIQYMFLMFERQPDGTANKEELKLKLKEYISHADNLKCYLIISNRNITSTEIENLSILSINKEHPSALIELCQKTPELTNLIDIAMCGHMYLDKGNYEVAIEKYNLGLNLMVKFLEKEPLGIRYHLLNNYVNDWKNLLKRVKLLLQLKD